MSIIRNLGKRKNTSNNKRRRETDVSIKIYWIVVNSDGCFLLRLIQLLLELVHPLTPFLSHRGLESLLLRLLESHMDF